MPPSENTSYDVIVVGAGGSGLAAAVSAAENGASVLVLEKQEAPGGSTGIAVGSFTASRTPWQKKAGIEDNPADHAEDAGKFPPPQHEERNNGELRRFFLEHAAETLDWLAEKGLAFHGPSPEPPNRVPRMHNVVPAAKAYVIALQGALRRHGGEILCNAPVTRLVRGDGRIAGVTASVDGRSCDFTARKGVVLAAGDYTNAPDLIAEFKGDAFSRIEGIFTGAHGDGHRLARAAGAELVNMDITYGPEIRFVPPEKKPILQRLPAGGLFHKLMGRLMPLAPKAFVNYIIKQQLVTWQHPEDALFEDGAILVNSHGDRFCNEKVYPAREIAIVEQPGKIAYILLDSRLVNTYSKWPKFISTAPEIAYAYVNDYLRLRPDVSIAEDSLEALAAARNLPADTLENAVEAFNRYAAGEQPDPFGREGDTQPLMGDNWVLLGPARSWFTTAEGSPAINAKLQVLDTEGTPIPGLYAAGQNGLGGQVLWGHGLHIGWAITSGRLVGRILVRTDGE
jgi:hypothetical protein